MFFQMPTYIMNPDFASDEAKDFPVSSLELEEVQLIHPMTEQNLRQRTCHFFLIAFGEGVSFLANEMFVNWKKGDVMMIPFQNETIYHVRNSSEATIVHWYDVKTTEQRIPFVLYPRNHILDQVNERMGREVQVRMVLTNPVMQGKGVLSVTDTIRISVLTVRSTSRNSMRRYANEILLLFCDRVNTRMGRSLENMETKLEGCFYLFVPAGWWFYQENQTEDNVYFFLVEVIA